jgi:hypothetical protein
MKGRDYGFYTTNDLTFFPGGALMHRLIIFIIAGCFFVGGCRQNQPINVPADFAVLHMQGPTHADWGSHHFIRINPNPAGHGPDRFLLERGTRDSIISKETGTLKVVETILLTKELYSSDILPFMRVLQENSFANMNKRYRDPDIMDGDYERLLVTWDGQSKNVLLVNRTLKRFSLIVKSLRQLGEPSVVQ